MRGAKGPRLRFHPQSWVISLTGAWPEARPLGPHSQRGHFLVRAVLGTSPIKMGLGGESRVRLALRIQEFPFLHQAPDRGHCFPPKVSFPQETLCFSHDGSVGGLDCFLQSPFLHARSIYENSPELSLKI